MDRLNIVLVGHVCIDRNVSEHSSYTGWGSPVLYMGSYLQKNALGSVTIVSTYGPDLLPYLPVKTLVPTVPNVARTLVYENDSRGLKRIQHCFETETATPPQITPEIVSVLQSADIIFVAPLLPNYTADYISELLVHAGSNALKVLCPQGYFRHIADDGLVTPQDFAQAAVIIPQFDLVVYSEEDYPEAFALAEQWSMQSGITVIVTQGSNGASSIQAGQVVHIPTTPIPSEEVVDSVGCGDTFAVTMALEYFKTKDVSRAIQAGHKGAAEKLLKADAAAK